MNKQSMIVRGTNGSGKTLSYLLPILDNLHRYKSDVSDKITFKIGKQNEDFMFQNATQILYDQVISRSAF